MFPPLFSLIQDLVRCPSVTPDPDQTFHIIGDFLKELGFEIQMSTCHEVTNFYARRPGNGAGMCFAGHVDVVPPGDLEAWSVPPFEGRIQEDFLWGRGVADMKGAIGCFMMAVRDFLQAAPDSAPTLSFLLTSDEEGPACHGTKVMVPWLRDNGFIPDFFLIGEPTGLHTTGECIKVGRRGSVTGTLTCRGVQGHIAYPHLADNPIASLMDTLQVLRSHVFDEGTPTFEPTRLEITSIDVGNPTTNMIPSQAMARFGIRLNTLQTCQGLSSVVEEMCHKHGGRHPSLSLTLHGEAYETRDAHWIHFLSKAVEDITGTQPKRDTAGGTTDGRFLKDLCPVLELGLPEATIHQVDERAALADIQRLKDLYLSVLRSL